MSSYDQFFKKAKKSAGSAKSPGSTHMSFQRSQEKSSPRRMESSSMNESRTAATADLLRQKLIKKKTATKSRRPFPWKLAGFSLIGLVLALVGFMNLEKVDALVRSIEISILSPTHASEDTKKAPKAEAGKEAPKDAKEHGKAPADGKKEAAEGEAAVASTPVKKDFTEDEINHFMRLNERKKELDAREEELNRLEGELQAQKKELEKKMNELDQTRKGISNMLEEKVQADDKKVEVLVQMYSNMKAQQAAKVFEAMDEDLAVEILGRMKKKNAAEIMNLVKPEKAQVFSEKYAGYKRKIATSNSNGK